MKRIMSTLLIAGLSVGLMGCGAGADSSSASAQNQAESEKGSESWTFDRKIELVCPWGAGGGADTTLREYATLLEKELNTKVVVNNVSGASGVNGVQYVVNAPEDGYTWLLCTPSPMMSQLTGATEYDVYGNITPVCNLVWDCNIFLAGKDAPYNNYAELMEYVDANPGSVHCGVMTLTGLDGACVNASFDGKIDAVAYSEGAQLNSDVVGGHVDLCCVGPAEVLSLVQSGDMKPILSCTEKRLTIDEYKNVECTGELGIDCYYGPYRGIFAKNGTPEAAIAAMEAASEKVVNGAEFQEWCKAQNLDQRTGWMDRAAFTEQWNKDHDSLGDLFGQK